ncbi:MAG: AGE family epimerase/isomerase [Actinomycetota bacterium]|nr:AGE family epimerase/isomerase [Actinomycetota bacterium]
MNRGLEPGGPPTAGTAPVGSVREPALSALPGADFYRRHLEEVVLPFWLERALDDEMGGMFTCFDNRGERLLSTDKYVWSQGRAVWLLSRAADLARRGLLDVAPTRLVVPARRTADFLVRHALLPDLTCHYLLDRSGRARAPETPSIYADSFVALGLAELARVDGDVALLRRAADIYSGIATRVRSGRFPSAPYPVPEGYRSFGAAMILLGLAEQLRRSADELGSEVAPLSPVEEERGWLDEIVGRFVRDDGSIAELVGDAPEREETVLGRHRTPGHALEAVVFAIDAGRHCGRDVTELSRVVAARSLEIGWDSEWGGLFRYVDASGGPPSGARRGGPFEQLVLETWDTKLWWPHSEAVHSLRLVVELTGDAELARWAQKVHDYTFATFPAQAGEGREWIQIRDRSGAPVDRVVALPVKDPFHVVRALLSLVELLDESTVGTAGR